MTEAVQLNQANLEREQLRNERLRNAYLRTLNPEGAELMNQPPPLSVDKFGVTTALEVGPAVAGGAAGVPLGPAGMIGGGALGAMAGRGLANQARNVERFIRSDEPPVGSAGERFVGGVTEQAKSMGEAGLEDLAFGTVLHGAGQALPSVLRFGGKLAGVQSPEVKVIMEDAARSNVNIGALDLDKAVFRGAAKVFGILPIIGGPIRKARGVAEAQVSRGFKTILDEVSPAINLPKLGVNLADSAKRAWKGRRALSAAKYQDMKDSFAAIGDPDVVPTAPIKEQVLNILGASDQLPKTGLGEPVGFSATEGETFNAAMERFLDMPEFISHSQLEALQKNLNRASRSRSGSDVAANEFRIITDINASTWDALGAIPKEAGVGESIMGKIVTAKRSWADMKALEETAAAKVFRRVDRNFFSAGSSKPGSAEIDEIADLFISNTSTVRSPEFIGQLNDLVGPENRKAVGRAVLERAASSGEGAAGELAVFDALGMRQKLGLAAPEAALGETALKKNKQALAKLLEGTGTSVGEIDSFLKTAQRIQLSPSGDPSTFLTRRIILGGTLTGGFAGAALAGSGVGLFSIGAIVLGGRQISKLISTKGGLKILREGMRPNLTRQQTVLLADRIRRALPDEPIEIEGQ